MYNKLYNLLIEGLSGASRALLKNLRNPPGSNKEMEAGMAKVKKLRSIVPQNKTRSSHRKTTKFKFDKVMRFMARHSNPKRNKDNKDNK